MSDLTLAFGRNTNLPEDCAAVWGARLIWPNDLLHDRMDLRAKGEKAKGLLVHWLDGPNRGDGAIAKMREALAEPYSLGLDPASDEEVVIYEDERGKIVGSAQRSHGYVYVAGWLKAAR